MNINELNIACIILAGGKGSRLDGKGKYNQVLYNKTLLEHVCFRVRGQSKYIAINFNRENEIKHLEIDIIYDIFSNNIGPLAGIHSALKYGYNKFGKKGLVCTVPVDTPFLPQNLVKNLYKNLINNNSKIVVAKSGNRKHPTIALWSNSLLFEIEKYINKGVRKIDIFSENFKVSYEAWKIEKIDPFFNINNYEDLKKAENMLKN